MHFVSGGTFNGKLKWVLKNYQISTNDDQVTVFRCYRDEYFHVGEFENKRYIILSGLEIFLQKQDKTDIGKKQFTNDLDDWLKWEVEHEDRKLILIGSDIGKGVVPMDREDRLWRDFVGWCYQDITRRAQRFDLIWYGIAQTLKNEEEVK
jgi:adenosylcobinamide kinase/adenosylcobinamide-phosphate guanylyltransferase